MTQVCLALFPSTYRKNNVQLILNRLMKKDASPDIHSLLKSARSRGSKLRQIPGICIFWYQPIIVIAISNSELLAKLRHTKYDISSCVSRYFNIISCFSPSAISFLFFSSHLIDNYLSLVTHYTITYISSNR